jgi:SNF2 family DNA or RNA helicase
MEHFDRYIEKSGMDKKSYQRDGVQWLLDNETRLVPPCGVRGGFVADEMGLGKTIMMIGLCVANFRKKTLIVLPPVLIEQWYRQIYKTTGHKCVVYHGKSKKKMLSMFGGGGGEEGLRLELENAVIVLCSYDAITLKFDKKKNPDNNIDKEVINKNVLHDITWGRVIFDEAHHLRNKKTGRFIGGKMLRSEIKWLVSGTPIQNKKQDFYALCSLINLPLSYYKDPSNYSEIGSRFILKRTKKQVGIQLENAVENKNIVVWKNRAEEMLAKEIHSAFAFSNVILDQVDGRDTAGHDDDGIAKGKSHEFMDVMLERGYGKLPLLLRARQSCIYPKMMQNKIEIFKQMGLIKDETNTYEEAMKHSSKLDSVVDAIMERKDNGNGKIVFCHFKEEMTVIAERLRGGGVVVGILDGKTSASARMKLLSEPKDVLIMQIQTGCEGLNLQENYSEIYFVSPHWNPYVEDQAIARCHRIGQMKPVFVWRFEMDAFGDSDTAAAAVPTKNLEEYVVDVQNDKRLLVSKIIE